MLRKPFLIFIADCLQYNTAYDLSSDNIANQTTIDFSIGLSEIFAACRGLYFITFCIFYLYLEHLDQCADSDGCGGCWTYALFQDVCYSLKDCSKTTFQERAYSGDVNCPPHSGYKRP